MEVQKLVIEYLIKTGDIKAYSLIWIMLTIVAFIQKTMMSNILSGDQITDQQRIWLAIIIMLHPILRYVIFGGKQQKIINNVINQMWESYLEEYDQITMEEKHAFPVTDLKTKLDTFEYTIRSCLDQIFPTIIQLIVTIYMVMSVFIKTGFIKTFVILIIITFLCYYIIHRRLSKKMLEVYNIRKGNQDTLKEKISLNLPKFEWRSKTVEEIMVLIREYNQNNFDFNKICTEFSGFKIILTEMIIAFILLTVTDNLVGLIAVTTSFCSIIISWFSILNNSVKSEADLDDIRTKLNVEKQIYLPCLPFDRPITITKCHIVKTKDSNNKKIIECNVDHTNTDCHIDITDTDHHNTKDIFSLKMNGNPLILTSGKHILIQGPSGEGKTTFLNALFGIETGIELSYGKPNNYFGNVVQMYQSIKENFKIANLSLRQIFDDSTDNSLIIKCLHIAVCDKWTNRFYSKHGTEWLDKKIGKISGGEKTRLAIAMLLFELTIKNLPILLLDEPEQGSDPDVAYKMIKLIIENFNDKLIIVISHLERIKEPNEFYWNSIIYINNGIVNIK